MKGKLLLNPFGSPWFRPMDLCCLSVYSQLEQQGMEADTCQSTLAGLQSQSLIGTTRLPGAKDWSQQLVLGTSNPQEFLEKLLGEGLHSHRCSLEGFSILGSTLSFWDTG